MPKKKFEVIKATTREIPGLTVGGRERLFARNGMFTTSDPGEAAEIDKVLGKKGTGEVVVTSYNEKEPGHNYTFGPQTSKAAEEFWERYEKKKQKAAKKKRTRKSRAEARHATA